MNKFAKLWPDELSGVEPLRDLGYAPEIDLASMVSKVLTAHEAQNSKTARAFKEIDHRGLRAQVSGARAGGLLRNRTVRCEGLHERTDGATQCEQRRRGLVGGVLRVEPAHLDGGRAVEAGRLCGDRASEAAS